VVGNEGLISDGGSRGDERRGKVFEGKENEDGGGVPDACPRATSPSAEDSADDGC